MAVGDQWSDRGGTRRISASRPTDDTTQAAWNLLTWTIIKGLIQIPDRGDTFQDAGEPTLDDSRKIYLPGMRDGGRLAIPFLFIEGDPGQTILFNNNGTNATISWQEADPDGTAHFWHGKILGIRRRMTGPNSNKGFIVDMGVNSNRFTGVPDLT